MKEMFNQIEKAGLKITFGLEAQDHITTIESELKRWNEGHKGSDMMYCKQVWEDIGKKIGWCPFVAALSYFEYLKSKQWISVSIKPKDQKTKLVETFDGKYKTAWYFIPDDKWICNVTSYTVDVRRYTDIEPQKEKL